MTTALCYAALQSEGATWGTVAGGIVDHYLPLAAFGLKAALEIREMQPGVGVLHVRHAEKVRRSVQGQIACPLYGAFAPTATKSFAQYLLEWAFEPPDTEAGERPSKTLHWFDDVEPSTWTGLRVDEATLSGDEGGITLTLSLVGKIELASVFTFALPDDRVGLTEFLFSRCALEFDGDPLLIQSFAWSVKHALALKHNGFEPSSLKSTGRHESFTFRPLKSDSNLAAMQRLTAMGEKSATLTLLGAHGGTGASGDDVQLSVTFPRLAINEAADVISVNDYLWQPVNCTVLKPQEATAASLMTWSLV